MRCYWNVTLAILRLGKGEPTPTLSSLAPAIKHFSTGFLPTGFPSRPFSENLTNAEALSRGRTLILDGLYYFDRVSALGCSTCVGKATKDLEYEKAVAMLEGVRAENQFLKSENHRLVRENEQLVSQDALLLAQLEGSRQQSEGLLSSSRKSELTCQEATAAELKIRDELSALSQQFADYRELYSKKVSDLDALCSERQVLITQHEKKLDTQGKLLSEITLRAEKSAQELSQVQQAIIFHQQLAEQSSTDLNWLLKQGIAECVRFVLRSPAFGLSCASLQEASIQLGRVQGCSASHEVYADVLAGKPLLYAPGGEKEVILSRYDALVEQPYDLLTFLASGASDVESLKKKLSHPEG